MTTNRASFKTIAGILDAAPRKPRGHIARAQREDAEPAASRDATASSDRSAARSETRTRARPDVAPRTPMSQQSSGGVRSVAFRAPIPLVEALRKRARDTGESQPNIVLDAIEANAEHLGELVAPDTAQNELFPRLESRGPKNRLPVAIRVSAAAAESIDELVAKANAANRTELIVAALTAYLGSDQAVS